MLDDRPEGYAKRSGAAQGALQPGFYGGNCGAVFADHYCRGSNRDVGPAAERVQTNKVREGDDQNSAGCPDTNACRLCETGRCACGIDREQGFSSISHAHVLEGTEVFEP